MFVRTERLLLRPGWPEDAPALFRAIGSEAVVRNLASPPWPYLPEHAEAFLATERKPSEASALIFLRGPGAPELIGSIGFGQRTSGETELGYWIAVPHWGRGYATEAGRAVLATARDGLRVRRLAAGHFLDNPASGRVLEKLGFRATGEIVPHYSAGRGEHVPSRRFELLLDDAAACDAMAA